ncbi:chromate efflux transporter [bacterium]|nr:chromate efflux transporter [bacterium]
MTETPSTTNPEPSLGDLARLFLTLGFTSFGGPAAHIALLENEVVRRRKWIDPDTFMDLLGATNLIPGPNSTEMTIHIGHMLRGWKGSIVAGIAFIAPAMLIVMALSWVYVTYGTLPVFSSALYGIKPVMMAIVAQALWSLGRTCLQTPVLIAFCLVDVGLIIIGVHELAVLFGTGLSVMLIENVRRAPSFSSAVVLPVWAISHSIPSAMPNDSALPVSLRVLFLTFLKIGSVLYGSGYVLLAYLDTDFVERLGWLSKETLLDAITIGQITPGPLFTSATFVGYLAAGPIGGLVATVGIFLPSFVFVALLAPMVSRMRSSKSAAAFLNGVNVASWVLMAAVTLDLGRAALVDPFTIALAALSLFVFIKFRTNSIWLILAGAAMGVCGSLFIF